MSKKLWPPEDLNSELAQIGRIILSFNTLEKATSGVLRQFIINDFSDRVILGLCESLTGVELERNLKRFAHALEKEKKGVGSEPAINHLIKVYQNGKALRNRIVHELSGSLTNGNMGLHKHTFTPEHSSKGFVLQYETLSKIVEWMSGASNYSAKIGIELSFVRSLRDEKQRKHIPGDESGWPTPIDLLTWDQLK